MNTRLFQQFSYIPKYDAQRNLDGRTHYADDATLRYFKSRILVTQTHSNGLLFSLVESVSTDCNHLSRGFRAVAFDLFGSPVYRPSMEECHKTRRQAEKALTVFLSTFDARVHTLAAIEDQRRYAVRDMDALLEEVNK